MAARSQRFTGRSFRHAAVAVVLAPIMCVTCAPAAASPGELDASFGRGGLVSFELSLRGTPQGGSPAALAFGPGGVIEVAGTASPSHGGEWRVFGARLLEDGALDPSFGSGGSVVTSVPPSDEGVGVEPDHSVEAGVLEAGGAMVLVGPGTQARLTSSGQFDSSFQTADSPLTSFALVELPDGDMLAAGERPTEGTGASHATLERVLPDGEPDQSFGKEGLVQLPDRAGPHVQESARSMLVDGGEVLVAGVGVTSGEGVKEETFGWLARVSANGSLDRAFGHEGVVYIPAAVPYQSERGVSLARESDGTIVLAATKPSGPEEFHAAVWGFAADGQPDQAFGSDGVAALEPSEPGVQSEQVAVASDNNGDLYVLGKQSADRYSRGSFVAALSPSGKLDSGFGENGIVSFPTATLGALGVDPAGRVVLAGVRAEETFLARLLGEAPARPSTGSKTTPPALGTAKPPLAAARVTCLRIRRARHGRRERCTLTLRRLQGKWKSALIVVHRHGHRIVQRRIEHLRMPLTLRFYLPASTASTRWTVTFHDGKRPARSLAILVR